MACPGTSGAGVSLPPPMCPSILARVRILRVDRTLLGGFDTSDYPLQVVGDLFPTTSFGKFPRGLV